MTWLYHMRRCYSWMVHSGSVHFAWRSFTVVCRLRLWDVLWLDRRRSLRVDLISLNHLYLYFYRKIKLLPFESPKPIYSLKSTRCQISQLFPLPLIIIVIVKAGNDSAPKNKQLRSPNPKTSQILETPTLLSHSSLQQTPFHRYPWHLSTKIKRLSSRITLWKRILNQYQKNRLQLDRYPRRFQRQKSHFGNWYGTIQSHQVTVSEVKSFSRMQIQREIEFAEINMWTVR